MKQKIGLLGLFILFGISFFFFFQKEETPPIDPYKSLYPFALQPKLNQAVFSSSGPAPKLAIKNDREKSVPMKTLKVAVFIENKIARTRYEMVFANPHDRDLEGELLFPLKTGQTISYFALEVNGELRPGVAVERTKARVAYEATVRKGVDPGLIEKIQGNLFRLRIFPVPAAGTKRVIIETQELLLSDAQHAFYHLPLQFDQKLTEFHFRLNAYGINRAPKLLHAFSHLKECTQVAKKHFTYRIHLNNFQPKHQFLLEIPSVNRSIIVANSANEQSYFKADLQVPLRYALKEKPKSISICWDHSLSRNVAQLDKEKKLLKRYLAYLREGKIELIGFANKVLYKKTFGLSKGQANELFNFLDQQAYDGATVLNSLPLQQMKGDEVLLFSDGLQTLGKQKRLQCNKPLYVIQSSASADEALLSALCQENQGALISLTRQSLDQAFFSLRTQSLRFLGFKEKNQIKNQCTNYTSQTFGLLQVLGQLKGASHHLTAQFGIGSTVMHQERLPIQLQVSKRNINEKMWAITYLDQLEALPQLNQTKILKLGLKYRLLTNQTSLLVLDAIEDYVEHGIMPPLSLQKKYKILRAKYLQEKKNEKAAHWKVLKKDWKEYLKWYANPRYEIKRSTYPLDDGVVIGVQEEFGDAETALMVPPAVLEESGEAPRNEPVNVQSGQDLNANGAQTFTWTNPNSLSWSSTSGTSTGVYSTTSANFSIGAVSGYASSLSTVNGCNTAGTAQAGQQVALRVAAWDPKTPYIKQLKAVPVAQLYQVYLSLRPIYQDQPSFFIDVCDFMMKKKQYQNAVRVLSNLAEMQIQDPALLRLLAQRLLQMKETKLALELFEQIIDLRPEEPQSYRDLGLALEASGHYQGAIEQLYKVVRNPYDPRFEGIHMIALNEINHIIHRHSNGLKTKFIDPIFIRKLPFDVRVVLNWDADDTDVDLWVTEPGSEKCMYSYQRTENGGRISNDFTQGFGPEEYLIKKAPSGTYFIQAHYYGNHRPSLNGKAQLTVQFYLHYGTPYEVKREVTRRLQKVDEEIDLATFEFD
ncbi:MAG: hypothetical protein RLZZ65_151 [Bacteroidota bacterium]|jgi:hypothetical protein